MKAFLDKFKGHVDYILISALSILWMLRSPLDFWDGSDCYTDSGVFMSIGQHMMKGVMPYRDIFDHKGPLIYVINWLGMSIKYYYGVWLMELITMVATALFVYKLARLFCNRFYSFVPVLVSFWAIENYFTDANVCEEYALPWMAMSLFFFADYLLNKKVTKVRLALIGFGCAMVSMLRINMAVLWVVFCLIILVRLICEKEYRFLKETLIWFLTGFCLGVLPFLVWLGATHSLQAFVEQYFLFNFLYSKSYFRDRFSSFSTLAFTMMSVFSLCAGIHAYVVKKNKLLWGGFIASFVLHIVLLAMSGYFFPHYGISLLPFYGMGLAYALSWLESVTDQSAKAVLTLLLVLVLSIKVLPS